MVTHPLWRPFELVEIETKEPEVKVEMVSRRRRRSSHDIYERIFAADRPSHDPQPRGPSSR
jgi:hypothetical protein